MLELSNNIYSVNTTIITLGCSKVTTFITQHVLFGFDIEVYFLE